MKKTRDQLVNLLRLKKKWVRVMKLTTLLFLFGFIHVSASVFSQGSRVAINEQGISLSDLLWKIQEETDFVFVFSQEDVKDYENLNVNLEGDLNDVLNQILDEKGLIHIKKHNVYVIKKAPFENTRNQQDEKKVITGKVVDTDGESLPGVSVVIKGSSYGIATDMDGRFSVQADNLPQVTLVFSFIGMKTKELVFNTGDKLSDLLVVLEYDIEDIGEVVVTGYQVIDKRESTSSISTVDVKEINQPNALSVAEMLQGRVPDVSISINSGEVGVTPRVRVRGVSTLVGNREPLWVLDGVVLSDPVNVSPDELNDPDYINRIGNAVSGINPQDIERIDVLKDASATALYGTRAANGVIVITTKKGRPGQTEFNYYGSTTLRLRPRYTDKSVNLMNSKERVAFSKYLVDNNYPFSDGKPLIGYEALVYQLYSGNISYTEFQTEMAKLETNNTDWFDLLTDDSWSQDHSLSMSGGDENTTYRASVGYTHSKGVINQDDVKRYTASLNLGKKFNKFSAEVSIFANVTDKNYYNSEAVSPMDYAYNTSRVLPAYNEDGDYYFYGQKEIQGENNESVILNYNVLNELENSSETQNSSSITARTNLVYQPKDWLRLNAILSYSASNTEKEDWMGEGSYYVANLRKSNTIDEPGVDSELPYGGVLIKDYMRNNAYTARLQTDINKYIDADYMHHVNASLGFETSSTKYEGFEEETRGYYKTRGRSYITTISAGDFPVYDEWLYGNAPSISDNLTNLVSVYGTVSYTYNRALTVNGNMRIDGSNKFGDQSNQKLLPIWSTSMMYDFASLLNNQKVLDYLRLKGSYGFQGNMLDGKSPNTVIKKGAYNSEYGEYISSINSYPDPYLKWEKTRSINVALETALFSNRLQAELSYFDKKTEDAFVERKVSGTNGTNSYTINGGDIFNKGYTVAFTVLPIQSKDLFWSISGSLTKVHNEMLSNAGVDAYELDDYLNGTAIVKGESISTFYSYKFSGLNPEDGGPLFNDGDYDSLINLNNFDMYTKVLERSGRREPNVTGGFNTTVRYKNFRFNTSFTYALGAKTRLLKLFNNNGFYSIANVNKDFLNAWKYPGDENKTNIPSPLLINSSGSESYDGHWSNYYNEIELASNAWEEYNYSNVRVVSADYLKCNNISLTYSLSQKLIESMHLSRAEVTFSGNNLFIIANKELKGQTPSQSGFTEVQLSERPSFSLSLNLTF